MSTEDREKSEQAAHWRERGQLLRAQIAAMIDTDAGEHSHPKELELFELFRTHSSLRDAANTAYMIGTHHQAAQDFAGAITAFRDARAAYVELADAYGLAMADHGIALMHASTREFDQAVRAMHESAAQLMQLGATQNAGRAHLSAAAFRMVGQQYIDAEPELDTADRLLSISYDDGHETLIFVAAAIRARLAILMREAQDAEAALQRAKDAAAQDPLLLAFVDDLVAQLALLQDDVPACISALEQAATKFQTSNEPMLAAIELTRIGLALEERGDHDRAQRTLRQSTDLYFSPRKAGAKSAASRVTPYLVVADIELDDSTLRLLSQLRNSPI
jgi:tetratricopeptide (TPR) repeat protein